jgi:glutathione synthase/RimK-type ligase-like ATP-grasp enzyme
MNGHGGPLHYFVAGWLTTRQAKGTVPSTPLPLDSRRAFSYCVADRMAELFHLAAAWDWEYDRDFIEILQEQMHAQRLSFYSISHHNTQETLHRLQKGEIVFGALLDRASESDENFMPLVRHLRRTSILYVNDPDLVHHAIDKATMHLEFLTKGIEVPFTIIISPYAKKREVELSLSELARLGRPFIIKPANTTGGGTGVILGAETLKDVIESRQHHKNDKYLLQEKVVPAPVNGEKGWFRVFGIYGDVLPCWWDDETHRYRTLTRGEIRTFGLAPLIAITRKIAEVCRLDFFSTEIALTASGSFVVVDYVNDLCDMRLQSKHADGVPDGVVTEIARKIARHMKTALRHPADS